MHDRVDGATRRLTVVVPTEHGCIPVTELEVVAPFVVSRRTHCAATIVGPSNSPISITAASTTYIIDPAASEIPPRPTTTAGFTLAVFPRRSVPVGDVVSAAYLVATDRGRPTSNVDFHVTIDGASPRALRWIAPGVAEIDVAVFAWRPDVALTVQGGGRTASAKVPVDPGPPVDVTMDVPAVHAGEPFALVASVRTDTGVPLERRVRVVVAGCAMTNAMFRCPAGPKVATVELVIDGRWVPLDTRAFDVEPLAAPAVFEPEDLALGVALRGGRPLHGWAIGARLEGALAIAPRRAIVASAAWRYMHDGLARELPLASGPVLAEHEGSIAGGMTWRPWDAPVFGRAMGGLSFVHATLGGIAVADLGIRVSAEVAAGVMGDRYSVTLGIRGIRDLVVAGWRGDPMEAFAEVSYAFLE